MLKQGQNYEKLHVYCKVKELIADKKTHINCYRYTYIVMSEQYNKISF